MNGSIRLIQGSSLYNGIVEICNDGVWGSIRIHKNWGNIESRVVCRELGLPWESK